MEWATGSREGLEWMCVLHVLSAEPCGGSAQGSLGLPLAAVEEPAWSWQCYAWAAVRLYLAFPPYGKGHWQLMT